MEEASPWLEKKKKRKRTQSSIVGVKQTLWADEEEPNVGRQKNLRCGELVPFDLLAVYAKQHSQEP